MRQDQQRQAEQRQTQERQAQERQAREQGRCDLNDPQPSISLERDESGKITATRASGFGEGCVGKQVRLEIQTEDGAVESTSPVSDERSATFELSRPVAGDTVKNASLLAS